MRIIIYDKDKKEVRRVQIPDSDDPKWQLMPGETFEIEPPLY